MADKALPSPEVLRQLLRYEPETGKLYWRTRPHDMFENESRAKAWNTRCAGKQALSSPHGAGYLCGPVCNRLLLAHRVIMAMEIGEWADLEVDHINGDRKDNRRDNLRFVSRRENTMNRQVGRSNTSGAMGVWWLSANQKWIAEVKVDGVKHHLGCFESKADAIAARKEAEMKHGFHKNHGRVA